MSELDPRTAIALVSVMSGLMALVLFGLRRHYHPRVQGLGLWSVSLLVIVAGGFFAIMRGKWPDLFTTALPNLLLCSGVYGLYAGTQRFHGVQPRPLPWLTGIVGVVLVTMWFTWGEPSYVARLRLMAVAMGVVFFTHAWFIRTRATKTFAVLVPFWVTLYMGVMQVVRLASTFWLPTGESILEGSPVHVWYLASFTVSTLLFSVGALLLAGERFRQELEYVATRDTLTQTLTRRAMNEGIEGELNRSQRTGRPLALLLLDLDHFKAVNDKHGHQAGDAVLVDFADRVRAELRKTDLFGRFGGEEFLVLLPESPPDAALQVAERIREACMGPGAQPVAFTVSIGLTGNHLPDDTVDSLLARADAALYRAKSEGRNRVVMG